MNKLINNRIKKEKRNLKGLVVSDKMDKTIVVEIEGIFQHQLLKKYYKKSVKYKVHDENNLAKKGDMVSFYQVSPISKDKSFILDSVFSKSGLKN